MTNQALWYRRFGPPADVLTLETAPLPPLPSGFLRVRMLASPINPSDLIPITGAYRHRVSPPRIAGHEGCGVVVEATEPSWVGRRVLPLRGEGVWQSFVQADPHWTILVPDDMPDALAARAYINPLAAFLMLESHVVTGRRVLLTAGGSACARLLGAWAAAAGATDVTSVHRAPIHMQSLVELGLTPIQENDPRLPSIASRADLVFDAVGGPLADTILAAARPTTDFISYGLLSGALFQPRPNGPRLHRFHLRDQLETVDPTTWRAWFDRLWPLLRSAPITASRPYPLQDWRQAITEFQRSGRNSKPLLTFS